MNFDKLKTIGKFVAKGLMPKPPKRDFTPEEALELREIHRIVSARKFEAEHVKANTALVPRGKAVAAELSAIATVLENALRAHVSQKLVECGYDPGEKVNVNLSTGQILPDHA